MTLMMDRDDRSETVSYSPSVGGRPLLDGTVEFFPRYRADHASCQGEFFVHQKNPNVPERHN